MNLLVVVTILLAVEAETPVPTFPIPSTRADVPALLESTAFVRGLSESALVALVPEQSGLYFVGCPNCSGGHQEEQLSWSPDQPDEIRCLYCRHRYPSVTYPANHTLTVRDPRGEFRHYPYWEDAKGYRYFFQARRDDLVRAYLADKVRDLALLSALTGERAHARRAALLIDRFARVFPGWCYHYDYPFKPKEIESGDLRPSGFRPHFRTARWSWWAYKDIPESLLHAYDWIRGTGIFAELSRELGTDVAARVENDLFRNAAEQVLANSEEYTNMSPAAWRSLVAVGRIIREPRYVHEVARRIRQFVGTRFFYDGSWPEGTPDYANQSVSWLDRVFDVLRGYSDPPGYRDGDGSRFDDLHLESDLPGLLAARSAVAKMRLPNGRAVPVHDTWYSSQRGRLNATEPFLLPALGHACLGGGSRDQQTQFHLTWSGAYGHEHADNLSLLLFAQGREQLSDLGYTHTRYRPWTVASASHNTVVIDGENQAFYARGGPPTDGALRFFDASDPRVQVVSADGGRGYGGRAKTYRRTLVVVDAGEGRRYAVDIFEVEGGKVHDYFLHGDAENPTLVTAAPEPVAEPRTSLLPAGRLWEPPRNRGDMDRLREPFYAYGFLRNLKVASVPAGVEVPITFRPMQGPGPALRVTWMAEPGSRLFLGENPSIRHSDEDDSQVEKGTRPFALLRHEPANGRSTFATVIEPYATVPFLTAIDRLTLAGGTVALRIRIGDRTDLVVYGADEPLTISTGGPHAIFQGKVGVLSLRDDELESAYALGRGGWSFGDVTLRSGGPESLPLRGVEGDRLLLEGDSHELPRAGDVVRLLTADGWTYPFHVIQADRQGKMVGIQVAEGPGLTYDTAPPRLRLTSFPRREHPGEARVEWTVPRSRLGRQP